MYWLLASLFGTLVWATRKKTSLPGWTPIALSDAGPEGQALLAELERSGQPAVTNGRLLARHEFSGGKNVIALYRRAYAT
jgi:hypothetical protein